MTDTVQQIKDQLSIQDILSPYMKLSRAGKSLVGLCPFHKEKTPSFHVSVERGTWHCFGCGLGGDGFSFIEKIENVDFKGALKILADKAGVQIEYAQGSTNENASKKERFREAMDRASKWYAEKLKGGPARAYAKQRGLNDDTVHIWRLGYAPDAWRALLEALSAQGFSIPELVGAGLIKEADGKPGTYYDRFRNRLMFPIRDTAGRVVAFTGRALSPDEPAKYLNSPETDLYHKSEILFGMDRAKDAIRARGFTMLVEGQMDVILAHQAGFENAVALSGTALSEKHLALMKRCSENLMLVLDADAAGLSATAKSAELALRQGLRVKAVKLPSEKDPADIIASGEGGKEFGKCISTARPIVDFFLETLAEQEHDPHRLVSVAERVVLPLIAAMPSPMEREHVVQIAARSLGLSSEAVRESLVKLPLLVQTQETVTLVDTAKIVKRPARELREEMLLAAIAVYPSTPLAQRIKSEYCRITEAQELPSVTPLEPALFAAEQAFGENPKEDEADELLHAFEETIIREAYQEAVAKLRKAETLEDASAVTDAQTECARISARLAAFGR